jgi:hypothetical protein
VTPEQPTGGLRYPARMAHVFEAASSGRAKCRACGGPLVKGELRFGERLPNSYGEGEMTVWFHPLCAAYRRPEAVLAALAEAPEGVTDRAALEKAASGSSAHRRLPRIDGAERAPSGQAKCRHCKERIDKGAWRIRLAFFEEGRSMPGGYVHLDCRKAYFEDHEVRDPVLHFSPGLAEDERMELSRLL